MGPGQNLAHYRIERLIGQGGMGQVFLALDTRLNRSVAIKVLPAELSSDRDRLERFRREAQAVAALNHPHIVTLHSVEEAEGTHFLTMELVEGQGLDRGIPPGGLPLPRVFEIGIALADALTAAHEKGIVHRDLKPANVMVTKDGRIKVLDFGLAKLALPGAGRSEGSQASTELGAHNQPLTDAGAVVGTVPYMSPEQLGGENVDARTDIFSLGVVLYEMATGARPFSGKNNAETISSILRDVPRPVTQSRQDVPRHLSRIIDHCLQKDPEARFQSAKDVRNELRALRQEVESEASAPAAAPVTAPVSTPSMAAAKAGRRPWIWAIAAAAVTIVIVAAWWVVGRSTEPRPTGAPVAASATETNSLAVLPFVNMSSDKEQEYFSDGLAEELLNTLVKIPGLKVAGRTSSFSFKGKNEDLRSIGEKLGVAHILEGSVRKSGDKVRITAQLVKAADGFHLWSETYDRTLDDIFAVQDDIAQAVTRALEVTLLHPRQTERPDAEAYDLVLQARFALHGTSEEAIRQGQSLLKRALTLSPSYAPAWAEMGLAHLREWELAATLEDQLRPLEQAREALEKALELDPELAVAHSRMAGVQQMSWQFAEAEHSTARALEISPRDPIVMGNAAVLYMNLGRLSDAISLGEDLLRLDPMTPRGPMNLSTTYRLVGRLDEAETLLRKAAEMQPDLLWQVQYNLGAIRLQQGRPEEARSFFAKWAELSGFGDQARLAGTAFVEHTAGHAEASKTAADEFDRRFGVEDPTGSAQIHAWRGEADSAFAWLDKALVAHDSYLAYLKGDTMFAGLHADPRWNALLKRVGLPAD